MRLAGTLYLLIDTGFYNLRYLGFFKGRFAFVECSLHLCSLEICFFLTEWEVAEANENDTFQGPKSVKSAF